MFKNMLLYLKYPSVAGIIGIIWVGSGILMIFDHSLPIMKIVFFNSAASIIIGTVGFRVDKS